MKRLPAYFFQTAAGGEPVRDWLRDMEQDEDRKIIGVDIATVEFGWPVGMPTCRPLQDGLYEVRSRLTGGRISRVLFYVDAHGRMVLLHGFIKKTQKTPDADINLARRNKRTHELQTRRQQ
jgi:phage-related protein